MSTSILIFIFVFTLIHYLIKLYRRPPKFPPGPPVIPILGSLPFLRGKGIEKFVDEYLKQFGDVVGTYIGRYPFILINDWKLAKELFSREVSTGRLENYTTAYARSSLGQNMGLITTDGLRWSTERTFALKQLKNFGLTKKHLNSCILPQAKEAVQHIESLSVKNGDVLMDGTVFVVPVLNVLWQMIAGVSLDREDADMKQLLYGLNTLFSSTIFIVASLFPWIRFLFPNLTGYNHRLSVLKDGKDMLRKIIHEHKATLNKEHPRDLIDAYLIERNELFEESTIEASEEQLTMVCFDLMAAGAETTSTTILWIVKYMVLNPDVQEQCFKEISDLIGSADVSLSDTDSLPFCVATIAEVQRLSAVAVSPIQHRLTEQTELDGYILPKNSLFISNIKHFMTDPKLWDKPKEFNPKRFLNENGEFVKPEYFVPLGHGRRICMGESLAKAELNIFFVTLIQNLKFERIDGAAPNLEDYTAGFTRIPLPYQVTIKRR